MTEHRYAGMTVNERLFVGGLMDAFDEAVQERDVERVRRILAKVELSDESMAPILEQLGLSP